MKTFTIQHKFSQYYTSHGWGNGYVIVPKGHPVHGMHYDDIHDKFDIDVHGGLTFSDSAKTLKEQGWLPDVGAEDTDWILGFDTAHYGDSMVRWPDERSVLQEANRLVQQLESLTVNSN